MFGRKTFLFAALLALGSVLFSLISSRSTTDVQQRLDWPGRNNTVLFLSNVESGLSNVLQATSHALLVEHSDLEVHYASFPKLSKSIAAISKFAATSSPDVRPITFHPLKGATYGNEMNRQGYAVDEVINAPGPAGLKTLCDNVQMFLMPWGAPEYLEVYRDIERVIEEVDPLVIVVEPKFGPGLDAARAHGRNHVIISPNALKDNFAHFQPWGSMFWKYPS
jgi:hypothetical protein